MARNLGGGATDTRIDEAGGLTVGMAVIRGSSDQKVIAPGGANVTIQGTVMALSRSPSQAGDPITIGIDGPGMGIAGGPVSQGDRLKVGGTNGRLVATTSDQEEVVAEALEAGVDGQEIGILHTRHRY